MMKRPFKPHELTQHRWGQFKSLAWTAATLATMAWFAAAEEQLVTPLPASSGFRTTVALMGFVMMLSCLSLELFWMPMPQDPQLPGAKPKDVSKWAIISSPLGILCFLTCQIMCALLQMLTDCARARRAILISAGTIARSQKARCSLALDTSAYSRHARSCCGSLARRRFMWKAILSEARSSLRTA